MHVLDQTLNSVQIEQLININTVSPFDNYLAEGKTAWLVERC